MKRRLTEITICVNSRCAIREDCYRYRAMHDFFQSYSLFQPLDDTNCLDMLKLEPTDTVLRVADADRRSKKQTGFH